MARRKKKINKSIIPLILIVLILIYNSYAEEINKYISSFASTESYNIENIPEYTGNNYVIINNTK